jgi:hypothetical protein
VNEFSVTQSESIGVRVRESDTATGTYPALQPPMSKSFLKETEADSERGLAVSCSLIVLP